MPYIDPPDWVNDATPPLSAQNMQVFTDNDRDFQTRVTALEGAPDERIARA